MSLTTRQILALQSFSGVGKKSILKVGNYTSYFIDTDELIEILSKCSVKKKSPNESGKVPITRKELERALDKADQTIELAESNCVGIISYYEPEFPNILKNVMTKDGKREDPPVVLFYKGDLSALKEPAIAVIGTRKCTPTAEKAGSYLASEFAKRGFCIVSGLALGCDTIGHKEALKAGGRTIAFLAHGLDTVYPPENTEIAEDIVINGGLLLSEYEIGTRVSPYNLVARDRLQAGLALATLVIQTGIQGGTMHAAQNCANSGKPLFVVKYRDQQTNSAEITQGNHMLVNKFGASYISGTDNLDEIANRILNGIGSKPAISSAVRQNSLFD